MKNSHLSERAFTGGLFIGLAQLLSCKLTEAGVFYLIPPLFFSFGLLIIMITGVDLYTGKIGYIKKPIEIFTLIYMLLFNFFGTAILYLYPAPNVDTTAFINRINAPTSVVFIKGIICGIFIYIAVYLWRNYKSKIGVMLSVMCFIIAGGEHCIANMAYIILFKIPVSMQMINFMAFTIIGNSLGSIIINKLLVKSTKAI